MTLHFGRPDDHITIDPDDAPLSDTARQALRRMVEDWIGEGFTCPPYTDAQYEAFEWLGITDNPVYDVRRDP